MRFHVGSFYRYLLTAAPAAPSLTVRLGPIPLTKYRTLYRHRFLSSQVGGTALIASITHSILCGLPPLRGGEPCSYRVIRTLEEHDHSSDKLLIVLSG
ncbi:hypothetical protein HD806DRAFT_47672 [Xylariaceae sp. AK1471]|nr:hypothetical protein HD806DRAFT_47672 [Xylariaceae sp. AK1471]